MLNIPGKCNTDFWQQKVCDFPAIIASKWKRNRNWNYF